MKHPFGLLGGVGGKLLVGKLLQTYKGFSVSINIKWTDPCGWFFPVAPSDPSCGFTSNLCEIFNVLMHCNNNIYNSLVCKFLFIKIIYESPEINLLINSFVFFWSFCVIITLAVLELAL